VNAIGAARPPSTPASRAMKPLDDVCLSEDRPRSMLSCVSKWLRDKSSLPANGTNASCFCAHSGASVGRNAGASAQFGVSASAPSAAPGCGLAIEMFGRDA